MADVDSILTTIFGLERFRPEQREIVTDLLSGRDTLVVMPTGAGKSLCYQLPAVALRGLTVIISPLIALMADQVRQMRALRIPAVMLSSNQTWDEQREVMGRLREGFRGLLFVSPERFSAPGFMAIITSRKLSLLAIDEAHCISQWGHDFRPEYLRLGEVRKALGDPLTIALTATATPEVRTDIVRSLALRQPAIHVTGFDRPNLSYQSIVFEKAKNKEGELLDYLRRQKSGGIVYCSTRKQVDQLTMLLKRELRGREIICYHAGMDAAERERSQQRFTEHEEAIVVATNAFGMGINKPNLRYVIHYSIPGSLEAYYQEAGRAGRDGQPAECILYFAVADVLTQKFFIDKIGEGNDRLGAKEIAILQRRGAKQLNAMQNYARWERCRRRQIIEYFGENTMPQNCNCDVCAAQHPTMKLTGRAAELAKEMSRPRATAPAASSAASLANQRKPRGETRESAPRERAPRESGVAPGGYWASSRAVRDETTAPRAKVEESARIAGGKVAALHGSAVQARFERLRSLRLELARKNHWPPYCVLQDATLLEIARMRPRTLRALGEIKGMGEKRLERYGEELLAELAKE